MKEGFIATARVGRTHGVEGYLRLSPFSDDDQHLFKVKRCVLLFPDGRESELSVDEVKRNGEILLIRFSSALRIEKARLLSGSVMYIPREEASPLAEGEYYVADLFGLDLVCDGEKAGRVEAVSDGAQALYLQVRTMDGRLILIPNMQPFVSRPDFSSRTITLLMKELLN